MGPSRDREAAASRLAAAVVGLDEGDARREIEQAGCTMQIVERDGRGFALYAVRVNTRVSVCIAAGVVVRAEVG